MEENEIEYSHENPELVYDPYFDKYIEYSYPEGYKPGDPIVIYIGGLDRKVYVRDDRAKEERHIIASQMTNGQQKHWFNDVISCQFCNNAGFVKDDNNLDDWCWECKYGEEAHERWLEEQSEYE